jgi:hypothetical protein
VALGVALGQLPVAGRRLDAPLRLAEVVGQG